MNEHCTCQVQTHSHHEGVECDRPAIGSAEEVEEGKDTALGPICLECYQLLAVEAHEADTDAVVDLDLPKSFLLCETPTLGT
jgi:hypothetical protein